VNGPNIPHRWLAEETAVFAIELADAFVSNLKARTRRVQAINEHAAPRCLRPKLLLILKRTHRGQPAEVMMKGGHAHARDFCETFHSQRLRIIRPDPGDRFCRPVALISQRCNRSKACSHRTAKDSVDIESPFSQKGQSCGRRCRTAGFGVLGAAVCSGRPTRNRCGTANTSVFSTQ
jgi:hypothetical protein